jgi:cardiolipin synthase A/B
VNVHAGFGGEGAETCISQEVMTRRALTQHTSSEDGLITAAHRGVNVRLILPGSADIEAADVARLKAGGVQLVYVSAPFIHAKVIVADGRLAFVGSENFSATSLDENREVGLLLADTTALATITTTFERDWAVGEPA